MNPVQLTMVIVVSLFVVGLGAVILQRNSRSRTHQLYFLTCVVLALWMALNFMSDQPAFVVHALKLNQVTVAVGMLVCLAMFSLAVVFPRSRVRISWAWTLLFAPIALFAVLAFWTPLIVAGVTIETWGTNQIPGPLFVWMIAWLAIVCVFVIAEMTRQFRVADEYQRAQLKYFYIGIGLFLSLTSIIAGFVPLIAGTNELARLEPFAVAAFVYPTAYAIARHRLMDVSYVSIRAVAYTALVAATGAFIVAAAQIGARDMSRFLGVAPQVWVFFVAFIAILGLQPIKQAIERASDRFFYRRTYDPNRLLEEMSLVVASALDTQGLSSFIASNLALEMKLTYAAVICVVEGTPFVYSTQHSIDEEASHGFLGVSTTRSVILADDLEPDSEQWQFLTAHGVRALVPLSIDEQQVGTILLGAKQAGTVYSVQDAVFLKVLGTEVSIALRNSQLLDEKNRRVSELVALNEFATALGADIEIEAVLDSALERAVSVAHAESGFVGLLGDDGLLAVAASLGLPDHVAADLSVQMGDSIVGWVATSCAPMILDGGDTSFGDHLFGADTRSAIIAPLVHKDQVVGVIGLSRAKTPEPFTAENLRVVTSFAGQLGSAVSNSRLYLDLEATFFGTISALAAAVDAKDPYTFGHSTEVTEHAVAIAKRLELSEDELQTIRIASTLHDIGKIGIDGEILHKPGALDPDELRIMQEHPRIGADILAPLNFLQDAVPLVLFHHERWSGGGYPSGVSGHAIPLGARVISVADAYNAMTSDRPYRKGLAREEAIRELSDNAGTQFDPDVVKAFLDVLDAEHVE
jgi:HD-GYP domain-containing protein (c-di-GMP phosphodiesterase class II)